MRNVIWYKSKFVSFGVHSGEIKQSTIKFLILICVLSAINTVDGQTNLLLNEKADSKAENWRVFGQAGVEKSDGDNVFVVRNRGYFFQDADLTSSDTGKFALLIGRGA